jgi:hypothetical protein
MRKLRTHAKSRKNYRVASVDGRSPSTAHGRGSRSASSSNVEAAAGAACSTGPYIVLRVWHGQPSTADADSQLGSLCCQQSCRTQPAPLPRRRRGGRPSGSGGGRGLGVGGVGLVADDRHGHQPRGTCLHRGVSCCLTRGCFLARHDRWGGSLGRTRYGLARPVMSACAWPIRWASRPIATECPYPASSAIGPGSPAAPCRVAQAQRHPARAGFQG